MESGVKKEAHTTKKVGLILSWKTNPNGIALVTESPFDDANSQRSIIRKGKYHVRVHNT